MALEIPTLTQLHDQAEQDLQVEADRRLQPALQTALAWALAGLLALLYRALRYFSRQVFVDTADDEWALLHASVYGVTALPAVTADGQLLATGTDGTIIPAGTVWEYSSTGVEYESTADAVIDGGEAIVNVEALEPGELGNLTTTGVMLSLTASIAGVDDEAALVSPGLTGGAEAETPAELKQRVLFKIRSPRRGGSEQDYEDWARDASSAVAGAWATSAWMGIGTVLVIIAKGWDPTDPTDSPIPSPALLAEVSAYIDERKPAGLWLVTVDGPTLRSINPRILLDDDTPELRVAVTNAVARHLATVEPGGVVYYDDLVTAINRAAGETHHLLSIPNDALVLGVNNVQLDDGELAVPGTIDWDA